MFDKRYEEFKRELDVAIELYSNIPEENCGCDLSVGHICEECFTGSVLREAKRYIKKLENNQKEIE